MDLMLSFVVAMTVTMVLIPPLMRFAGRANILDQPESRKVHTTPIPRVGGIAMAAGVLAALALWGHFDRSLQAFCAGVLVLLVFGVWDDRATLGAGTKFLGQAIAVVIAMVWGGVSVASITVSDRLPLPNWIANPLTFFFLIGATNAINLSDGLDGLAGGMTLLCLGALALLALTVGDSFVAPVALVTAGSILGFLRFNTHPARVFMGDCGSQILGFSVAVLSVSLTQDPNAPLSSALPLLLLGVPVMDTLTVMTERALAGHSPFKADRTHLHHRLLSLGFDHHEAVIVIYLMQALLFVAAWFMRYQSDLRIVLVFTAFAGLIISSLRVAAARGWRWRRVASPSVAEPTSALGRSILWLRTPTRLPRWCTHAMSVAIVIYGVVVIVRLTSLSSDLRVLIGLCAATLALNLALRWRQPVANWIDKAALYVSAVFAVYADGYSAQGQYSLHYLKLALFSVLAFSVLVRLYWSQDRRFAVTSLDLLVIFMALAVPNLPDSIASPQALGASVAKMILLLYGLEFLSIGSGTHWRALSATALVFLIVCVAGSA